MKVYKTESEAEETLEKIMEGAYPGTAAAYILLSRIILDLPGTAVMEKALEIREELFQRKCPESMSPIYHREK